MNRKERINHVLTALKETGCNRRIEADGEVGMQAFIGCAELLQGESGLNGGRIPDDINPAIIALKEAGFGDDLAPLTTLDGHLGEKEFAAVKKFLRLGLAE